MKPPAPRPCESCPYRRDVPSGVWAADEYEKLPEYDRPTYAQPHGLFQCHQADAGDDTARVCAGWIGCHGTELIAVRLAVAMGRLPESVFDYQSPVPLFESGTAAAEHGLADIEHPTPEAVALGAKIATNRQDVNLCQQP